MDEILRSNARVGAVCDGSLVGVAVVSVLAAAGGPLLWALTASLPLALGLPAGVIAVAIALAALVQGRAVRRHEALCAARTTQAAR